MPIRTQTTVRPEPDEPEPTGEPVGVSVDLEETGEISLEQLEELEDSGDEEDEEAELEELVDEPEVDSDEHEVELDEILALQFGPSEDDDWAGDEADTAPDTAALVDLVPVPPAGAEEFVCLSCFLIKHRRQMADASRRTCHDCAVAS